MSALADLALKSLGPMLEKFKPELEEFTKLFRSIVDCTQRIETKLDAVIEERDALKERFRMIELRLTEHDDRLGIVPPTPPEADGGIGHGG